MRSALLGFLILLACASESAAHGSIAYGYDANGRIRFFTSQNQEVEGVAEALASEECRVQGLSNCDTLYKFENTCVAVAVNPSNARVGLGVDFNTASTNAVAQCLADRHGVCNVSISVCDATPVPEPVAEPELETSTVNSDWFGPPFVRELQIEIGSVALATVISCALVLWTFLSIVSSTPAAILKRRVAISAWIALPAMLAYPAWQVWINSAWPVPSFNAVLYILHVSLLLWTNVFVALLIGGAVRRKLLGSAQVPDPLSLPLATFAFTIISVGLLNYLSDTEPFPTSLDAALHRIPRTALVHISSLRDFVLKRLGSSSSSYVALLCRPAPI
jgi:hypothetical protein